jgi:hypothetical protein
VVLLLLLALLLMAQEVVLPRLQITVSYSQLLVAAGQGRALIILTVLVIYHTSTVVFMAEQQEVQQGLRQLIIKGTLAVSLQT